MAGLRRVARVPLGNVLSFLIALSVAVAPTLAQARAVRSNGIPAGTNQIVPDGRTWTNVGASGPVTTITTGSVLGKTGYNSFSTFKEGTGNTVNLVVPGKADNLVNIVRDAPVVVNGILNRTKNGAIAGNIFFADPYGFVVGSHGTVNVGSLTVSTPTRQALEGVIARDGAINQQQAARLMNGDLPISPDGVIAIRGRVNAQNGVRLQGQTVTVGRDAAPGNAPTHHDKFQATVNTTGQTQAAGINVQSGSIDLMAAQDISVNARLSAGGVNGNGGAIGLRAGRDVGIGAKASPSANAGGTDGNGGLKTVKAGRNLAAVDGARLSARAAGAGNGGSIELSAVDTMTAGNIVTDLFAPNGRPGLLLYDPTNLIIGVTSGTDPAATSYSTSIASNGADIVLQASNSITVAGTGVVDSRNRAGGVSVGDSGAISISPQHCPELRGAGSGRRFQREHVQARSSHLHRGPDRRRHCLDPGRYQQRH
ncbi:MAG: leukotoxin LktA family filamentous adhesin [Rhodopila sp.]